MSPNIAFFIKLDLQFKYEMNVVQTKSHQPLKNIDYYYTLI